MAVTLSFEAKTFDSLLDDLAKQPVFEMTEEGPIKTLFYYGYPALVVNSETRSFDSDMYPKTCPKQQSFDPVYIFNQVAERIVEKELAQYKFPVLGEITKFQVTGYQHTYLHDHHQIGDILKCFQIENLVSKEFVQFTKKVYQEDFVSNMTWSHLEFVWKNLEALKELEEKA